MSKYPASFTLNAWTVILVFAWPLFHLSEMGIEGLETLIPRLKAGAISPIDTGAR
jgi:hypothetical protein